MALYAPTAGDRFALHIYDLLLELDAIERGDIEDQVTQELVDGYDPIWWMHALRLLASLRSTIEDEVIRCISDTRVDYEEGDGDPDEFFFAVPTWEEIGKCLGVSAQAAQQRYGKRLRAHSATNEPAHLEVRSPDGLAPRHPAHARLAREERRPSP